MDDMIEIAATRLIATTRQVWFAETLEGTHSTARRQLIKSGVRFAAVSPALVSALAWHPSPAQSQITSNRNSNRSVIVGQIVDMSSSQQDVSKDFLVGCRAAWQDINARGGVRGRSVTHLALETDGTLASLQTAWMQLQANPQCVVISGCTADPLANQINTFIRGDKTGLANVAPWLQNSSADLAPHTYSIFATREEQIAYALKSLSALNMIDLAVVFASAIDRQQNLADIQRITQKQNLRLQELPFIADLNRAGQSINATAAPVVLFVGGTPELVQFTQGLEKQARQRYIVALADVNLQVLQQLGGMRTTPVIATQAVPTVNSSLPIVRGYRDVLAKLYDEPPTSLSLAGFIAARYTFEVMQSIDTALNRNSVLDAFARRNAVDVGGFKVVYDDQRRTTSYVTQSMLAADGRVIG
jgi:ABC-type branched-subunit amino acid transport system substrate-binding protein